eukprot:TRINITY_DN34052_c0_g1_i1.p1 TRINITY_DN34052_c0_g1~~TRINITY_DN34052_c0_g1_i1.p1  ORF type:complete len:209 (+),score=46.29 TRINITY_DN34052_c0_g1_i1:70-696(+)
MMGGWKLRIADLKNGLSNSTTTMQRENEMLISVLRLGKQILSDVDSLKEKSASMKAAGGAKLSNLPKDEMDSYSEKLKDIRDTLVTLTKTHQFPFNPQLVEYISVHMSDFDRYEESEEKKMELEKKKEGEPNEKVLADGLRAQELIKQGREEFLSLKDVYRTRNCVVLRNEGYFLHSLNNIHYAARDAEETIVRYDNARIAEGYDPLP